MHIFTGSYSILMVLTYTCTSMLNEVLLVPGVCLLDPRLCAFYQHEYRQLKTRAFKLGLVRVTRIEFTISSYTTIHELG